jgi:hypothetical protein
MAHDVNDRSKPLSVSALLDYRGTPHWSKHERFLKEKQDYENAVGLYLSSPLIAPVRLDHIWLDNWGAHARVNPLPTDLLPCIRSEPWEIAAGWEFFSFGKEGRYAMYSGWRIALG